MMQSVILCHTRGLLTVFVALDDPFMIFSPGASLVSPVHLDDLLLVE